MDEVAPIISAASLLHSVHTSWLPNNPHLLKKYILLLRFDFLI